MGTTDEMSKSEWLEIAAGLGPSSKLVTPNRIGTHNIQDMVAVELSRFEKEIRTEISDHLRQALDRGEGIIEEDGKVYLTPVDPITSYVGFPTDYPDPNVLIHRGRIITEKGSNLDNLKKFGVFGNPREDIPTYLKRPNASAYTFCSPELTLFVDKGKLLERRTVFFDPEAIDNCRLVGDVWKNSYFIVGGIPKEAILEYRISRNSQ